MVARWPVGAEMYVFVTTSRLVLGHPVSYHKHLPQVLKTRLRLTTHLFPQSMSLISGWGIWKNKLSSARSISGV
jgi:hypothetical protein